METLLCRFVKQPRNLIHVISSPNPAANVQVGSRQIGASVEKNGIQCSSICHNATVCTNTQVPTQASRAPLLSPVDRAILDKTGWLSDMHLEAANVLLREAFPAVDGLQNPIFQQNMSFSVPSFEFVQFLLVNKNHGLVISNIGEEMDTVCIYDSMQNRPDGECISLVTRYVQCPDSHITIKVMNVQLQDNGYACGELAVAFATSLFHGEDPTQLHYKELCSHFKNCVDTYSITPLRPIANDQRTSHKKLKNHWDGTYTITLTPQTTGPYQLHITMDGQHIKNSPYDLETVVSHQPRFVHEIRKRVYCKSRAPDNGNQ